MPTRLHSSFLQGQNLLCCRETCPDTGYKRKVKQRGILRQDDYKEVKQCDAIGGGEMPAIPQRSSRQEANNSN